jgi:hypothetical protein
VHAELLFIVHPFKSLFLCELRYFNAPPPLRQKSCRAALLYFLLLILFRAGYSRNYFSMHISDRWPVEKCVYAERRFLASHREGFCSGQLVTLGKVGDARSFEMRYVLLENFVTKGWEPHCGPLLLPAILNA